MVRAGLLFKIKMPHIIYNQTRMMIAFSLIAITVAAMEEHKLKMWEESQQCLEALETNDALK